MKYLAAAFFALLLAAHPLAQASFEVAAIKENRAPERGGSLRRTPGGGVSASHVSPLFLILTAYGVEPYQMRALPPWASDTFYDVEAKAPSGATRAEMPARLQALLVERFALTAHREMRELEGFRLMRLRDDRLGPGIRESSIDCLESLAEHPECRQGYISRGEMKTVGLPLEGLRQLLVGEMGAPVEDGTGLSGNYNLTMTWSVDVAPTGDAPALPTALREQLGLRLEPARVATELLVIDSIERPTPN